MEPASKVITNHSTKSYIERELLVSLDNNGPVIGPTLEIIETIDNQDENTSKDYLGPRQFSKLKKNAILFIVSIAGAMSPIGSTVYYPAIPSMQTYFHTNDTTLNASLFIFIFFTAFFPLIWASLGEHFGRRIIYLISTVIAVVGNVCCAISINIQMFITFRAISAIGSSAVLSMGAGTIADIFESHERGRVFAYYTLGPLLGPAFGPIIGGYLNQGLGWRSNFWFLAIFALCIWIAIFFLLPETSRSFPTQEPTEKQGAQYIEKKAKIRTMNPLRALKLLLYPNITLMVAYVGVLFFFQYLNSAVFTRVYTNQYGLNSGIVGVCYLPYAVGAMIGGNIGGRISDKVYNKRVAKAKEKGEDIYPEMRLSGLVLGCASIIQLLSLVAYGWCIQKEVHFAYGLVCQFLYGSAFMLPNVTATAYIVDSFRKDGASATACNNFVRYVMAGIGSLVSSDLEHAMGDGPLFTFGGATIVLFTINIYFVNRYAKKWAALKKE